MHNGEKVLVGVAAVLFIFSLGRFAYSKITSPFRAEEGVYTEGIVGRLKNTNPVFTDFNDADRDIAQIVFSGLIRYDPLEKNFFPDLAEKWDRSSDGKTYTFTLRDNVFWHDGTPFTAEDVLFTFHDIIQHPTFRNPLLRNQFQRIKISSSGPRNIIFVLPKANSYFLSDLTIGILPRHILGDTPALNIENSTFGQAPIGTGPYQLTKIALDDEGDYADLSLFPQYYGKKPTVPRIRFFTFPNEKKLVQFQKMLRALGKIPLSVAENLPIMRDRFSINTYSLNQFSAIFFNTENPFLKEKKMRQALRYSLDKKLLLGTGERRVDGLDLQDHSAETAFKYRPEETSKILEELGFRKDAKGSLISSKAEKVAFRLLAHAKTPVSLLENIVKQWQAIGVEISYQTAETQDFISLVEEHKYDILLIRQNLGYNRDVYPLFHSNQIPGEAPASPEEEIGSGLNYALFKSFRTDGLTEAIRKEKDPDDKEKLLKELSAAITDEAPLIFLSTPIYAYALEKDIATFPVQDLDFHSNRFSLLPYLIQP
ncbi:hypothetical protein HYV58_00760 [Candidatus Peregrinibacteria bacterium]|nr:hypothetical protein [Candidatus Peregrinibacteria bacterium]